MVFSNEELKNMAYRSANLGLIPQEDFILDEKKIINGYKTKKYGLNERIGELGESLSDNIRKVDMVKSELSKEVIALNKANSNAIEEEISKVKEQIDHQKTDIKNHIRRCQLNGDILVSDFNVNEISDAKDFEPQQVTPQQEAKAKPKSKSKRVPFWLLYVVEVLFIFGEGILFYNILTETHDLPEIILRSIFFIPIVFAASFLTSRRLALRWVWLPTLLILSVYAILSFTVMEWFFESQALDETLTFSGFFIKNGFLILGAVMMVTLALFLTNAVKSMYRRRDAKVVDEEPPLPTETKEKSPQQLDLDLKFLELKGLYKRLKKLEEQLAEAQIAGKVEFKRILGDVSVLEQKASEVSAQIGECEKELSTLEINSLEELNKYREHYENYSGDSRPIQWKTFDFTKI